MFKIAAEPTFTHDVTARVPVDGGYIDEKFRATFRTLDPAEAGKFDLMTAEGSTAFLKRAVVKLDDIGDAQGKAMEWSDALFDEVLKLPWARAALARAYFSAVAGAKAGN
jgi:hypothetical protein